MSNSTTNTYQMKRDILNYSKKNSNGCVRDKQKFIADMIYGLLAAKKLRAFWDRPRASGADPEEKHHRPVVPPALGRNRQTTPSTKIQTAFSLWIKPSAHIPHLSALQSPMRLGVFWLMWILFALSPLTSCLDEFPSLLSVALFLFLPFAET